MTALREAGKDFTCPSPPSKDATPDRAGSRYAANRRFRFAIPSLQLKSGVRFELANRVLASPVSWSVDFYFGTSKSIIALKLSKQLQLRIHSLLPAELSDKLKCDLEVLQGFLNVAGLVDMQRIWSRRGPGATTPFMLLDQLDATGESLTSILSEHEHSVQYAVGGVISAYFGCKEARSLPGLGKLARNAPLILAGLLIGCIANTHLESCSLGMQKTKRYAV